MSDYPAQSLLLIENVKWQENVTSSILDNQPSSLNNSKKYYESVIFQLISLVRKPLNVLKRTIVCTLLVIDVHLRDVIYLLLKDGIESIDSFNWIK